MPTSPGPLFLGMDAMDSTVVRALAREGNLPVLAELLETWEVAPTLNPPGLVVGGLWPSFWSGTGPGHHGSYCFRQVVPGGYETSSTLPSDFDTEPFWLALDRRGHRCTIFDVPLIRPIPLANGRFIGDWGTHDRQLPSAILPDAVEEIVITEGGTHPIDKGRCDTMVLDGGHTALYEALLAGIEQRTTLLQALLAEPDDLMLAVFSESHCAGHHFWHLHDPTHPRHDPSLALALDGDPLVRVYERLDAALGRVLKSAGDRPVMILLSHGIGSHNDGNHLLDETLERIELNHYGKTPIGIRGVGVVLPYLRAADRHVRRATGWGHQPVPRSVGLLNGTRRWYQVPNNDLYGGIRLNLQGREPFGRVRPGKEMNEVIELLTTALLALRNDDTGQAAVQEVLRCDDLFEGPRRDWLPDLFVAWNWGTPIETLSSPAIGNIKGVAVHVRTGDHRPPGLVLTRNLKLDEQRPLPVESLGRTLFDAVQSMA